MVISIKTNADLLPYLEQFINKEREYEINEVSYSYKEQREILLSNQTISIGIIEGDTLRSVLQIAFTDSFLFELYCKGDIDEKGFFNQGLINECDCIYFSFAYFLNSKDGSVLIKKLLEVLDSECLSKINFTFAVIDIKHSSRHLDRFGFEHIYLDNHRKDRVYVRKNLNWLKDFTCYHIRNSNT